jgi:CDP-glucose 4,6-dehydratase
MKDTFYNGKRVFVTGHTGFKGSWLCSALLLLGAEPVGYALAPETEPALFDILKLPQDMESHIGDIRDLEEVKRVMKAADPDIVIHMAAQPIVRTGYADPVGTYETNVMGTVNLFEACRGAGRVRSIVNVTTDKVYENKERQEGYLEDEMLCGRDPYSNSKSCSELVTASYRLSFFEGEGAPAISTARSGNVIGGGDFAKDRIIPDCVRAAMGRKEIEIRNPKSVRPYQHVLECLFGYLLLAEKQWDDPALAGAYNFGPAEDDSVDTEALVKLFCAAWGDGASYQIRPDGGPHEANLLRLDTRKAREVLGWKPMWNVADAVENTVAWTKAYMDGNAKGATEKQIAAYF